MTPQQPEPISDEYEKEAEYIFYNTRTAALYSGVLANESFLIAAKEDIEGIKLWLRSFAAKVRERTLDEVGRKIISIELNKESNSDVRIEPFDLRQLTVREIVAILRSLRPSPEQKGGENV